MGFAALHRASRGPTRAIPVHTGIQSNNCLLDCRLRGNDEASGEAENGAALQPCEPAAISSAPIAPLQRTRRALQLGGMLYVR
jgi:hypothetical protein